MADTDILRKSKGRRRKLKFNNSRMTAFSCLAFSCLGSICLIASVSAPASAFAVLQNHWRSQQSVGQNSYENYRTKQVSTYFATPQSTNKSERRKRRPPKKSVDDLVANMGLAPVPKKAKIKQQKVKNPQQSDRRPCLKAQLDYSRNGHCVLRNSIHPTQLHPIRKDLLTLGEADQLKAWRQKVQVAAGGSSVPDDCETIDDCRKALDRLGIPSDQLPFLQYFNTWRRLASVKKLALDLAETASILLDVPSVRLYQDSFFWKRSQDGPTPWHVDARMAPFDTPSMLTLWVPLHDIPRDGSALHFVSKSHADFALPFWNPYTKGEANNIGPWNQLEDRYQNNRIEHYMPLAIGDVTVHAGWTLHCADGQSGEGQSKDRLALAISYVDARAPVRANVLSEDDHGDDEDQWSYVDWVKQVPAGQEFEHPLVPIVWPSEKIR